MAILYFENYVAFENEGSFFALKKDGGTPYYIVNPGISLEEWAKSTLRTEKYQKVNSTPGNKYKRIWKPVISNYNLPTDIEWKNEIKSSEVTLKILYKKAEKLFEYIEPNTLNLGNYSHRCRELLLLACMEVESSLTSVFIANEHLKEKYTTNDYVKLLPIMALDGYELKLEFYPDVEPFCPFAGWNKDQPTKSLEWYNAYNKTKHDRENNLQSATLKNVIYALGAATVLFRSQFGFSFGTGSKIASFIKDIFSITTVQLHANIHNYYIPSMIVQNNKAEVSNKWIDVNF